MKKWLLAAALTLGAGAAWADDVPRSVDQTVARWNQALNQGRVDELMHLYAKDAMVLLPDGKVIKDPREIRRFWEKVLAARHGRFEVDVNDVLSAKGDTVVSTLRWTNVDGELKYAYDGVIYNVFKKQADGTWKAQAQRWN
ncbi:hypothetical protein MIT9_P2594 [Methylomarinovum caldicuralii]|uniref:SnoaL-like domain-containing protein n=2 Tax=Methylomarinovum caldicuralii TaxID=438856 RepID=A0AAU9CSM0_9GAMM|nr:hypothetical protein MIT9_P2594 [Methylomarinovum caldicuralii]